MKRNHIRIVVRGRLGDRLASSFEGMTLVASRGMTELQGHDLDQAQLHGILSRIRDLGLELVSVTSTDVKPDGHAGPT